MTNDQKIQQELDNLPTPYVKINSSLFDFKQGKIVDITIDKKGVFWYKVQFAKGAGWLLRRFFDFWEKKRV